MLNVGEGSKIEGYIEQLPSSLVPACQQLACSLVAAICKANHTQFVVPCDWDRTLTEPISGVFDFGGVYFEYKFDFGEHEAGEEEETIMYYHRKDGSVDFFIQSTFPKDKPKMERAIFHELIELYVGYACNLSGDEPQRHAIALALEEKVYGSRIGRDIIQNFGDA